MKRPPTPFCPALASARAHSAGSISTAVTVSSGTRAKRQSPATPTPGPASRTLSPASAGTAAEPETRHHCRRDGRPAAGQYLSRPPRKSSAVVPASPFRPLALCLSVEMTSPTPASVRISRALIHGARPPPTRDGAGSDRPLHHAHIRVGTMNAISALLQQSADKDRQHRVVRDATIPSSVEMPLSQAQWTVSP